MLVEDDAEAGRLRFADDGVELGEPAGIELVGGIHVVEREQVEPDMVETRAADFGEMAPLEASLGFVLPIGVVAKDIDPAVEREGVDHRRAGTGCLQGGGASGDQCQ